MSMVGMLILFFISTVFSIALFCLKQFESARQEIEKSRGE